MDKRQQKHENRSVDIHKLQPKTENLMKISAVIYNLDVAEAKYISRNRKRNDEGHSQRILRARSDSLPLATPKYGDNQTKTKILASKTKVP